MVSLPGRTPRSRTLIGTVLLAVGALLVLLAVGPLHFVHRVTDRTDVPGTVKVGYSFDSSSANSQDGVAEIADGESGFWKVDYEIDGKPHTGLIVGSYSVGEEVMLSAPGDGSVYRILSEADSAGIKLLGWFVALAAVAALGVGTASLASGMRAAGRQHQLEANQRVAASLGIPQDVIDKRIEHQRKGGWSKGDDPHESARSVAEPPQWQKVRQDEQASSAPNGFFHRPYDLDDS